MKRKKLIFLGLWVFILIVMPVVAGSSHADNQLVPNLSLSTGAVAVGAQTAPLDDGAVPAKKNEMSLLDLVKKGGVVGYCIIVLSVVSIGLIIDYGYTIRRGKILPVKDIVAIKDVIEKGDLKDLNGLDHPRASFLSRVAAAGLKESHLGYPSMIKAMEDAGEALSAGIVRKIEHLNVIGNISPMLGLLGTVIGMLRCFNELAHVVGAIEPKQLAGGIFEALVTTCMGLIVAIPALYCYAVFKNRVDEFTGEAALKAEQLMASFKREEC